MQRRSACPGLSISVGPTNERNRASDSSLTADASATASKRRVGFSEDSPQVSYIPSLGDYSSRERRRLWYDRSEIESSKQDWYVSDLLARKHKEAMIWHAAKTMGYNTTSNNGESVGSEHRQQCLPPPPEDGVVEDQEEQAMLRRRQMYDAVLSIQVFERAVGIQVPDLKAHICNSISSQTPKECSFGGSQIRRIYC